MQRLLAVVLVFVGCSSSTPDVCSGSSSCVAALIEASGTVPALDDIRVTIDEPTATSMLTPPSAGGTIELPAIAAIVFPASLAGQSSMVTVDGLSGGNVVATATQSVLVPAGTTASSATFALAAGSGPPDMAAGLVVSPSVIDFGSVARGSSSGAMTFMLTNDSTSTITLAGPPTVSGSTGSFSTPISTDCPAALNLPAGKICTYSATFKPLKIDMVGELMMTVTITETAPEKTSLTITFKGDATP